MLAIYKRELRSYFCSMIGYIFIAAAVLFLGIYFLAYTLSYGYPYASYTICNLSLIFIFIIPILTMKCFAEERKTKTDQMLLTAPVSVTSVVLGKFFAAMTVVAIPLVISCLCPLIIGTSGEHHYLVDFSTIFAMFIMSGVYVSIGIYLSSLTDNQIVAAVISFAVLLVLYLWDTIVAYIPATATGSLVGLLIIIALFVFILYKMTHNTILTTIVGVVGVAVLLLAYNFSTSSFEGLLSNILSSFSLVGVVKNFAYYYSFDIGGLFLYLTLSALFLFLTIQAIQKRRWS